MGAAVESRVPVAMRWPRRDVEAVDEYARAHGITKTDAFLHFLHCGMEHERRPPYEERFDAIESALSEVLAHLQTTRSITISDIMPVIYDESEKFSAIKRAIIFGSFAKGEATTESDIDVRLELDRDGPFSLYDMARFQKAVERRTGREVQLVTADDIGNVNLAAAIEREGIVAYERQGK